MEKIRFGIIGLGTMGMAHAETILTGKSAGAALTAVVTASEEHVAQVRAMPGGDQVAVFSSAAEMYASGRIDAVLIVTPHRLHVDQTIEAMQAGIHVLLEKPTGVITRDVRKMNAVADETGLAFGVMFNQRANPAYKAMKDIVSSGELGEIRRTNVIITDWFRAQSYYEANAWRGTWNLDGGGVLLNQAPHNLDLWQWICGMPVRMRAFCGFGRWHDVEIEDDVTAYVEYANGATGSFITCTGEAPGTNRFEVSMDGGQLVYEHGRLLCSRLSVPASRFIREYKGGFGMPEWDTTDITPDAPDRKHAAIIEAFAGHILNGTPMIADGREGLNSLMLSNGMLMSSWDGQTIDLPFDDDRFAELMQERAANSRPKAVNPISMDVSRSGY